MHEVVDGGPDVASVDVDAVVGRVTGTVQGLAAGVAGRRGEIVGCRTTGQRACFAAATAAPYEIGLPPVHETDDDRRQLQELLDRSYEAAGAHLRSITTPQRRLSADQLCRLLVGVQVMDLATVTASGEPRVAPVDGLFFRARWWFGSSPESVRFQHIRRRPAVSASHTRGEDLAVVTHGRAVEIDLADESTAAFRAYYAEIYGPGHLAQVADAAYAFIEADRMYTFAHDPKGLAGP